MGGRIDVESTAQENSSQILDEKSFSFLSQTVQGLSEIESNEALADFVLERDNLDDALYIFKFISEPKIFSYIAENSENKDIVENANLLKNVLQSEENFLIHQVSSVNLNEEGIFIAYVYKAKSSSVRELHIAWKNNLEEGHLFNSLLEVTKASGTEYPNALRSFGALDITLGEDDIVKIRFFGDASRKDGEIVPGYAPGILKNFKQKFEEIFQKQFPDKEINIEF